MSKMFKTIKNKIINFIKRNIFNGFSIVEVVIAMTIFTLVLGSIIYCYSILLRVEKKTENRIYESAEKINEISEKYYTEQDQ